MRHLRQAAHRGRTALRIVRTYLLVRRLLARRELPDVVHALRAAPRSGSERRHGRPARLGAAVASVLRIGPLRARCLVMSLVLYRLLLEEGYDPVLLIGMPEDPDTPMTHAWVEIAGHDVGPPPGRGPHRALLRFEGSWGAEAQPPG